MAETELICFIQDRCNTTKEKCRCPSVFVFRISFARTYLKQEKPIKNYQTIGRHLYHSLLGQSTPLLRQDYKCFVLFSIEQTIITLLTTNVLN